MSENEEGEPPTSNDEAEAQTNLTFTPTTSNEDALQELIQSLPDDEPAPADDEEELPPPAPEDAPAATGEEAKTEEMEIEIIYENSPPSDATESQKSDAENTETDEFSELSGAADSGGEQEAAVVTSEESIPKSPEEVDSPDEDIFLDSEEPLSDPNAEDESAPETGQVAADVPGESDETVPDAEELQPDQAAPETEQQVEGEVQPAPETEQQVEGEVEPAPETEQQEEGEVEPAPDTEGKAEEEVESAPETEDKAEGEVESAPETEDKAEGEVESAPETEGKAEGEVEPTPETEVEGEVESAPQTEGEMEEDAKPAPETGVQGDLQGKEGDEAEQDEEKFEDTTEEIVDQSQQEESPEKQGEGDDKEDQPPAKPVEIVEVEDWVLEAIEIPQCVCEPMWDYYLSVPASMVEPQIVDTYKEETLEENFGECRPMWDFDLCVPASLAEPQFKLADDVRLDLARDDYHCVPMWDYDLLAPLKHVYGIEDEITWELSNLNFLHGIEHLKDDKVERTSSVDDLNKYVQTYLHFEPSFVINAEDMLIDDEELEYMDSCQWLPKTSYPEVSINRISDNLDISQTTSDEDLKKEPSDTSLEFWYPSYLNLEAAQEAIRAGKGPLDTAITFFLKIVLEGAAAAMQKDGGPPLSTESALFGWYAPHPVKGTIHGEGNVEIKGILICSSSFDSEELIFLSSLAESLVDRMGKMKTQLSGDESPEDVYRLMRAIIFQILGLIPESTDLETFSTSMAERYTDKLKTSGDSDIWTEFKKVIESEEENVVLLEEYGEAYYLSHMMEKLLIRLALPVPAGPEDIYSNIKAIIEECITDKVVLRGQPGIIPAAYSQDLIEMVDFITLSLLEKVLKGEDLTSTIDETMTDIVSQRQQLGLEGSLTTMLAQSLFVRALMMSTPPKSETCDMNLQLKLTIDRNIAEMLALRGQSEITSDQLQPDMKAALEKALADILLTRLQGQVQSNQEPTSLAPVIEEGVAEVMTGKGVPPALASEMKSILEGNAIIIVLRGQLPVGTMEQEPPPPEETVPSLSVEVRISPTSSSAEVEQLPAEVEEQLPTEEDEQISAEEDEQISAKEDEQISAKEDEQISAKEDEQISAKEDEQISAEEDEQKSAEKMECFAEDYEECHKLLDETLLQAEIQADEGISHVAETEEESQILEAAAEEETVPTENNEDEYEEMYHIVEENVANAVEMVPSTTDSFVSAEGGIQETDDEFQDAKDIFEPVHEEGIPQQLVEELIHHAEDEAEKDMGITEVPPTILTGIHTYTEVELEFKHAPDAPEATYEVEILAPRMRSTSKAKGHKKTSTDEALKRFRTKFAQEIAPVREKLKELHDKVAALDIPAFTGVNLGNQFQQQGRPICYCKKSSQSSPRSKH